jgi:hypothetical protein
MEILAFITFFAMGNTINQLESEVETLSYFQEQNTDESIKQQEQINDLIINVERLEIIVEKLEERYEEDFINLAAKHSAAYARHETLFDMQQIQMDMIEMQQDQILEEMSTIRE